MLEEVPEAPVPVAPAGVVAEPGVPVAVCVPEAAPGVPVGVEVPMYSCQFSYFQEEGEMKRRAVRVESTC